MPNRLWKGIASSVSTSVVGPAIHLLPDHWIVGNVLPIAEKQEVDVNADVPHFVEDVEADCAVAELVVLDGAARYSKLVSQSELGELQPSPLLLKTLSQAAKQLSRYRIGVFSRHRIC